MATSLYSGYKVSLNDGIFETWIPFANPTETTLDFCWGLTTLALSTYAFRRSSKIAAQYFRQRWGTPVLVRETSVISAYETFTHPITTLKNIRKRTELKTFLKNLMFSREVETKYTELFDDFFIRRRAQDPFRNLFIHGPPGNGKSLLAKRLALNVDIDYMVMAGTDLAPLGRHMATRMQEMFQWIQRHKAPILLIVDESEVFLGKRHVEDFRAALDVFFRNTAKPSNNLMLSLVANDPKNMDGEVYYRMDDIVNVTLPDETLREQLLQFFVKKHMPPSEHSDSHQLLLDLCSEVTSMTDTMSCRDIEKLVMSWKSVLDNNSDTLGRRDKILKCCQYAVEQQNIKNLLLERKKGVTKKSSAINTLAVGHPKTEEVTSKQEVSSKQEPKQKASTTQIKQAAPKIRHQW
ncbi:ATPase family AAA domain-containing protein 3-like [Adelges cooleyi]|uniref:ATPase family AAA domain-containing protein 3-like n=1 Tax=Adelges cooleyi TaxID=133065 RepID=UPI0021802862|nr:ATPase family AAA domain-containing protein 3-like [Adelges cooleyi]